LWRQVVSQSPVSEDDLAAARGSESAYRQSLGRLNALLRHGGTLSGHEANCAFLNTQGKPFATVSSVTGFDFLDDARALALCDWDADGDVDVWVTNRTSPRVRFLRNDAPSQNHWLSLRLVGRTSNRDAIGARVEVVSSDQAGQTLVKSLRAGEGFLAQSSKSLHFGLGSSRAAPTVRVHWPGGSVQEFANLAVDRQYLLTQDEHAPRVWKRPAGKLAITPTPQPIEPPSQSARIVLSQRIPLPRFVCAPLRETASPLSASASRGPLLLNLWASWCAPCLEELQQLTRDQARLRAAGLNVFAICVDDVMRSAGDSDRSPAQVIEQLAFPFDAGRISAETLARLQTIHEMPLATHVDLPVPISFLLDRQQRVAIIYRGPVDSSTLLADVRQLELPDDAWRAVALPAPGRWNVVPRGASVLRIPRELVDRRQLDDALEYVQRNQALLRDDREFPKLLVWMGDELLAAGRIESGLQQYRAALAIDSQYLIAMNNLAWQLATHPDESIRDGSQAVHWAEHAARLTRHGDAGVLDTLAAAYAEAGRFADAVNAVDRARQLAERSGQRDLAARLKQRADGYRRQQPFRQPTDP
jgi:thiol-disulfide isomerase/thioredoxin